MLTQFTLLLDNFINSISLYLLYLRNFWTRPKYETSQTSNICPGTHDKSRFCIICNHLQIRKQVLMPTEEVFRVCLLHCSVRILSSSPSNIRWQLCPPPPQVNIFIISPTVMWVYSTGRHVYSTHSTGTQYSANTGPWYQGTRTSIIKQVTPQTSQHKYVSDEYVNM